MNEMKCSKDTYNYLSSRMRFDIEELWAIALDSQLNLIACDMIFRGTNDSCLVHPRDVFRFCIQNNACQFIIAHSHPSQNSLPSNSDLDFTKKLSSLSRLMEIPLIDHIIITHKNYFSFADQHLIKPLNRKGELHPID